ncbi:MAG: OmpA family protein [marine benthic group bacterium]|nr:OmpA family protein [Gemmatimonadota bacterium]
MRFLSWLVGLALLALLAFFCVNRNAPRIESELTAESQAALQAAGLSPALVSFDGRDACLPTIADPELADQAYRTVEAVRGVRVVNTGCGELKLAEPYFHAKRTDDGILIEGSMIPDEASRVYGVVNALGPSVPVAREIVTDGVGDAAWTGELPSAIRLLAARVLDPEISIKDGQVTVSGRVPTERVRQGVIERLGQLFPGFEIVDRLETRAHETADELQRGLDQFVASRVVEFDFDSDALTAEGRATVEEVAATLASLPGVRVEIAGHTDSVGEDDFNMDLSQRRAESVRNYLVELGLARDRFDTTGFGETRPIADNETEEGRHRNRRTEFRVLD